MSIQTLRRELADLPIARLLKKHQTFATHAKLQNATVRAVRDLDGNPYYRPRAETVRRWLQACESPMTFEAFIGKHGVTVADLESRDVREEDRAGRDREGHSTSGRQAPPASATVTPSFRLGAVSDVTSAEVRRELSTLLIDIAAVITDYAAQLDPDTVTESQEAETRAGAHGDATHSQARKGSVRR